VRRLEPEKYRCGPELEVAEAIQAALDRHVKRAAGHVRVSQERNVQDCYGLASQEADVRRLAKYMRFVLVDIYREEGASGYLPAASLRSARRRTKHRMRPELERFLADAKAGRWDVAVFPSIDRAGRSVRDVIEIDAAGAAALAKRFDMVDVDA